MNAYLSRTVTAAALLAALSVSPALAQSAPQGQMGMMPDFATLDANGDGKISPDEMKAFGVGRVAGMDANKDGFVTKDEMKAFIVAKMTDRVNSMVDQRFAKLDPDNTGKVSLDKLENPQREEKMFKRMDKNGDGVISKDEFDAAKAKMAKRMEKMQARHHRMMDEDLGGGGDNPQN